jgi:hypothetical protein
MFQRILVLAMAKISTVIYFSAGLLASDYFQTGLAWGSEDQRAEVRAKINAKINERYQQKAEISKTAYPEEQRKLSSINTFSRAYDQYFDYAPLCEIDDLLDHHQISTQTLYNEFLNSVFDGFLSISQNWHAYYNVCVVSICEENIDSSSCKKVTSLHNCIKIIENNEQNDQILRFINAIEFKGNYKAFIKTIEALLAVRKDDRDSVYRHATQTAVNHKGCPDLFDFLYLVKRISEIPPEHRHIVLKKNSADPNLSRIGTWLRIIRQANMAEYYVTSMYKFIPYLDENSFWSIFVDYSYNNWFPRYPRAQDVHTMPTEEHLDNAYNLFHEGITHAYFLPKSQEATEALRLYLSPWFPVSLVYKMRSCKALEPCW